MNTQSLLEVKNLRAYIGTPRGTVRAVDDVSFTVDAGQALGIVGESGSGKSVLARAVMGLMPPRSARSGEVTFQGRDLLALSKKESLDIWGKQIAMVFQDPGRSLNPVVRVERQLTEGMRRHLGITRSEAHGRALDLLREVGVPDPERRLRNYPHEMSGGMRQRVMIAIALACEPDLLIADEPTTALDVTIHAQILSEVQKLAQQHGTSLIWITHDLSVVAGLADDVAVMYAGRIVEHGKVDDVLDRPQHPYTVGLIDSLPSNNQRGQRLRQIPGMTPNLLTLPAGCAFAARCARATAQCGQQPAITDVLPGHQVRCFHPSRQPGEVTA